METPLTERETPTDSNLARLYRLQVRELQDFAMFLMTPEGIINTWNRGVKQTFGYSEQEWIGQPSCMIFTDEDIAAGVCEEELRTAAEHGRSADLRWHKRKDGTLVYMTGVMNALRDDDGNLIGYSKIVLDDTTRKQLEDALTRSNADLQQFAFLASHDLQEPLRTVAGLAQLLSAQYRGKLDAEADEMLAHIVTAVEQMSTLITDLLAYSRLARAESRTRSLHLDDDMEAAKSLLRASIEASGAVITHDPLPTVQSDRNQMVRLFENLLGNAIKFRRPDVVPRIHVSAERAGEEWIIRVTDNGIGFPPDQGATIFEPFKRLHSTDQYPGSGIGLASCKRIVESYKGRIGAESRPGEGSTFWFTVPVKKQEGTSIFAG